MPKIKVPGTLPDLSHASEGQFFGGSAEDLMNLGDMYISLHVVLQKMNEDEKDDEESLLAIKRVDGNDHDYKEMNNSNMNIDSDAKIGVSYRMGRSQSLSVRTHLLLVHSMLHLVGYDHNTDEEERVMVEKEEEVIQKLLEREE